MKLFVLAVAMALTLSTAHWTWSVSTASAQGSAGDVRVVTMKVSPDNPSIGDTVEVLVTVVNFSTAVTEHVIELSVDETIVDGRTVRLDSQQSKEILLTFTASQEGLRTVTVGDNSQTVSIAGGEKESKMRVGATVRLQATKTVVMKDEDAVVDLFWDNSLLNDKEVQIEVIVQVPTGLYVHSEIGAIACSAGTCKGQFTAAPGSARNMPIIIKADAVGDYFLNLNGRYWPKGEPDAWNPVNLTTPIYVKEASAQPQSSGQGVKPTTGVTDSAQHQSVATGDNWWLSTQALVIWLIIAVVIIAVGLFWAVRAFRPPAMHMDID